MTMLQQQPSLEFESPPGGARPEFLPHRCFRCQHGPIARPWSFGEVGWGTILNNLPPLNDQHPCKCLRLADIVCDTDQGMPPHAAGTGEQLPALLVVEPAERLVEDHQPYPGPEHRSPQPHPLPLPT